MKKFVIAMMAMLIASTVCYAADKLCVIDKEPTAKEPIGAVVETTGVFVGKIVSAAEIAFTGERKLTVENETGECKIFPFCAATKLSDETFNAVTFNQLKRGEPVKVEYAQDGGVEKAKTVIVETPAAKKETASGAK